MKYTLTILTFLFSYFAFGQNSRSELANSKIYIRATYFDKKNEYIGLQTRTDFADTIIEKVKYRKFQTSDFTDYSSKHETKTYYETFANDVYCLLDNSKKVIHKINYQIDKEQTGTIFGKQSNIFLEFIDTRNSYPKDSLVATRKTPRKYYQKDNSEIYLVIIPDLQSLVVSSNGQFYTKQLMGDNYNDITNGFKNNFTSSTKFDIQKGDEIQLFYRRKWYDDTTNVAEYQDKQFKNFKYLTDTIVNNTKALKFEVEGYNYLSGSYDSPQELLVTVTDSGYYVGYQFVPFQDYKTELKIVETEKGKELFLQGVTFDTINGNTYPKIVQAKSDPYRYYILPFFPMPFIEFGNVQGIITYTKIKGIEKGKKREREYITDKNNIRDIISKNKKEVEVIIFFVDEAEVEIEIQDSETGKVLKSLKSKTKKGLNSFVVRSDNFEKDKQYTVQINYKNKNNSGSFSNSVTTKY
ncbi:hypothetical protein FPG87_12385 [Flavobacterium psychrophilum]|jgi:hypothetical protein|nr:hypothetical protein [Flavobacterium psychrophilum]OAE90438.1 hypothetical protein SU65_11905 [Flavobacterium psychrophilum]OJH12856.1 hypothetical protein FPG87_12385 [Flavobacterium psychrophilum]OUD27723.1 hypothetical protein FPG92_06950 [Flavobacterium psychrophilum]